MKKHYKLVNFNKGGAKSGSSGRVVIPKDCLDELGINKDENNIVIYSEDDKIIIQKVKKEDAE